MRVSVSLFEATPEAATQKLEGAGLKIEGNYGDIVTGSIQAGQLQGLASLEEVKRVDTSSTANRHE